MEDKPHILTLYIAGKTLKAARAIKNINTYCSEHLRDSYILEVVDLAGHPEKAASDQIIAVPTLIRKLPEPIRIMVGDLPIRRKF